LTESLDDARDCPALVVKKPTTHQEDSTSTKDSIMKTCLSTFAGGRYEFLLASLLATLVLSLPVNELLADAQADAAKKSKDSVRLIVDFGDGVEKHFAGIKWREAMTVQDVTEAASKHPRGIKIKQRGKKATAFLSQIDDLANQPRGRSWVYRVNDKLADRSFGVYPVEAGDVVQWSFQNYP